MVVTLGVLTATGYMVAREDVVEDAQATCEGSLPVSVAASPSIATALTEVAEDDELAVDGTCVTAEVTPVPAAEAVGGLGEDGSPDLWIPDSSMWTQRVSAPGVSLGEVRSIATSPLVVVAPRQVAEEQLGWPESEISWLDLLSGEGTATVADPMTTSEGLATLLAAQEAVGGEDQTRLVEVMSEVSDSAVADVGTAYERIVDDASTAGLFTAAEQSVVAHNQENPRARAVALYPTEGTLAFDYPAIPVETADTTPETREAVTQLIDVFTSDAAREVLLEAGFRAPDGTARDGAGVVDGIQAQMPTPMPSPDPTVAATALRQWAALSLEMRMLAVIDVSGSMLETDGGDQTRAELVRDAATTGLGLFRESSAVGMWAFSTLEDGDDHWRELVEVGELSDDVGDNSRLEALAAAAQSLPEIVSTNASEELKGWTALYDTTWAAFQEVKENYDPNRVNSVVLMTDGRDERPESLPSGMDLETLLTQLRSQHDPANPVPVITIGIGPDADMAALQQISEATGTTAYQAQDPADIEQVFLRAMVERQCRPNC